MCDVRLGEATVLFALLLGGLVYAAETIPPRQAATAAVSANKEVRPPVIAPSKCAQETWPNITADCLRYADSGRPLGDARVIIAERQ